MKEYIIWFRGAVLVLVLISCKPNTYSEQHLEVVLRDIGHQVLLAVHDSTSRVLPIEKISVNTYQISFQNTFAFVPDTLIKVVHTEIKKAYPSSDYIVSVLACGSKKVFYAFEMSSKNDGILPCKGREQADGCYVVQIAFKPENSLDKSLYWLLFIPLSVLGLLIIRKRKAKKPMENTEYVLLGQTKFFPQKNILLYKTEATELSAKESKLLNIFAQSPNQIIERERLMKEVWEDEGIIVISRNLDVSISKLRKKLQHDSMVKITNVHAKGYKLEV
jgi:DNA-binding winged helix-turn-helix (wHTH) protein